MNINEGGADRVVRLIVGIALLAAAYFYFQGTWAWVAGIVGAVALLTGAVGICPAYAILGIDTCPLKRNAS